MVVVPALSGRVGAATTFTKQEAHLDIVTQYMVHVPEAVTDEQIETVKEAIKSAVYGLGYGQVYVGTEKIRPFG